MTVAVVVRLRGTDGPDPSILASVPEGTVLVAVGQREHLSAAIDDLAPSDVIVVDGDVVVPQGWVEGLSEAARTRTDIATVSAAPMPGARVIVGALESSCVMLTRRALNVVGFVPGQSVSDFARRSTENGFTHVLSGDIVAGSVRGDARALGIIDAAVGGVQGGAGCGPSGGLVIGIDAELIDESLTGTFEAGLAISLALARQTGVTAVHWIALEERVEALGELLAARGTESIGVSTLEQLSADSVRIDVAFRPYQDYLARTWSRISEYAHRNVVWTLDLIANVTPGYARSIDDFHRLNRTSSQAWQNADAIGVLTTHVGSMLDAYHGGTSDPRIFVLPAGSPDRELSDPLGDFDNDQLAGLGDAPFVLMLGSNYKHKARAWFMRVMRRVFDSGWGGAMVLAGPTPEFGNSSALEALELAMPGGRIIVAGRVGADDRSRLLSRATLVVAPSVTEGWGMIPAEAVAHGSVPLASLGGGLRDITPADAASLTMSDDATDAATLTRLLTDGAARSAQRESWKRGAAGYTWDGAAAILVEHMRATLTGPRHFAALVRQEDIALDPVRPVLWRVLDRVLPRGRALRSAVARLLRWSG